MNLDRLCYLILFSVLPLLYLPQDFLIAGIIWAGLLLLLSGIHRDKGLMIAALLIGISYCRIVHFAENLQNQTAYSSQETIHIQQILNQQDYQRAIAKRADGSLIYLNWQSDTPLVLSRNYLAELHLKPLNARLNDGNFNRQRWLIAQHIQAMATVKKASLSDSPLPLRTAWLEQMKKNTETLPTQGLLLALAFGERAWLSPEHWQTFQQTATAHLIAISGLHIGLAMGIGFLVSKGILWLIGGLCHRVGWRQAVENPHFFALFCGFLTACGYSFLAGFAYPTLRAIIAITLVLSCRLARRHWTEWQYWLRCVALLLIVEPLALLSDSFWLSVLAVAALIGWYRVFPLSAFPRLFAWQRIAQWRRWVIGLLHLQIGITLCFLPVQFYFFEGTSPFAFLANLLIVPLYSIIIVPLILAALLLGELLPIWAWIDALLQLSLTLLEPLSHHWLTLSRQTQWQLISLDLFLLALLYYRTRLKQAVSLITVSALAFSQLPTWLEKLSATPELEWLHFDVGQGLAMALIDRTSGQKRAIIYDTGAGWKGGSMAELEIIPYLKRHGIAVEAIILSHDDNDHSGGIVPLLNAYPNSTLILSGENRYTDTAATPCIAGQQWQFGSLKLKAIYPTQLATRAKNEDSCVILAEIGQFRLLLTGDSGVAQENQFSPTLGKLDFLQAGHHGSKTSTGYRLLAHTRPDYAIISAARFNAWKMPHASVMARLNEFNVKTLNTAERGMIRVRFYADHYEIETARESSGAWYQAYLGH